MNSKKCGPPVLSSRWHYQAVLAEFLLGCSGQVDLGGDSTGAPPDPIVNDVEQAQQTIGLMKINAVHVSGLSADASYLYLSSLASGASHSYYIERCSKVESWRTLTPLTSLGSLHGPTELNGDQLGWVNENGLQICHVPDCRDAGLVKGATFEDGYAPSFVWNQGSVYWCLNSDRAIYRCELPNCLLGPQLVATDASASSLALVVDRLYWLDVMYGILRTPMDGSAQTEQLTLGATTTWVQLDLRLPDRRNLCVYRMAIDGPFIYASLIAEEGCTNETTIASTPPTSLVRWKYTESGAARELLLSNDSSLGNATYLRVFDSEVVWGTSNGEMWSCLAEQCAATKRQFGVHAYLDTNTRDSHESVAADEQYFYWLSGECIFDGPYTEACNLKRTPRIAR